jgi:hypothetical protein
MKIVIETIPHAKQRYSTCGDWFTDPDGTLHITVSEEMGEDSAMLVAIHELIEMFLCQQAFVTQEEVDAFDKEYERNRKPDDLDSEPGEDPKAPYREQHRIAKEIELRLCQEIMWSHHCKNVARLNLLSP